MRELHEVEPSPMTELAILQHGLAEIAQMAPGIHGANFCYDEQRKIKDYALRILQAADEAPSAASAVARDYTP